MQGELFWKLGSLSDEALVRGLQRVVSAGRRTAAELVAHLCEVEERRLHLDAGYPSMFAYCTGRLGFSEDEASRRIDVARLARRAPIVFRLLAEGKLSLSAAALLRPHLLSPDLAQLVEAVSGRSVQGAREALAALFPRPDVATSIRKLPPSKLATSGAPPSAATEHATRRHEREAASEYPLFQQVASSGAEHHAGSSDRETAGAIGTCRLEHAFGSGATVQHTTPTPRAPMVPVMRNPSRAEPLAPGRFKVQFTADAALKEKLELSRDLMRHAVPSGDLATILTRALDLLIEEVMRRRFGKRRRKEPSVTTRETPRVIIEPQDPPGSLAPSETNPPSETLTVAPRREPVPLDAAAATGRAAHRAVLERDGLRCTWRGPDGTRCTARAWLERDHRHCRALGGPSNTANLRHLCKAHNRRAAEHVYGTQHIERAILREQTRREHRRPSPT
jgi:hypothetical protein